MSTTEKPGRRARPAVRRGDARLGGDRPALGAAVDAEDARRFRALLAATRFDVDEEGGLRLVTALPPMPEALATEIHQRLRTFLTTDRALLLRAVDQLMGPNTRERR